MGWEKGGLIFAPSGDLPWARSYATLPTAYAVSTRVIRVYYASLDADRYGRIGYVEVDARDPRRILYETGTPVLDIGDLGTFEDSGVNPSCLVEWRGKHYLYYIGWQRCERVPYMLFSGLAESTDGGVTFHKWSRTPILDRTSAEPFSRSAPFVLVEQGRLRMWYWTCLGWSSGPDGAHYNNVIRHATSRDGIQWDVTEAVCIAPDFPDEYSAGRPWVVHEDGLYKMWYSIRSHSHPYAIGYAESADGLTWTRMDHRAGITRSESGWDSQMLCYPCVVNIGETRYLFYNGNRHGASGFGFARWTDGQESLDRSAKAK